MLYYYVKFQLLGGNYMRNKTKRTLAQIIICVIVLSSLTQTVNAAIKLNTKSKTLNVGQSTTLKVKGTKKKVKWSSSNKKVATVTQKGKVTAKKAGTAKIKAKIGKQTLKCKIKVKAVQPKFDAVTAAQNISYTLMDTGKGVVAILQNNNKITVSVSAKLAYYKNGAMIDTRSEENYGFESGRQCSMFFDAPYDRSTYNNVDYDDYKISISCEQASENLICGSSTILVNSNPGVGNISAEIQNASGEDLSSILLGCVFFDAAGNAIGYREHYAECNTSGGIDYLSFDFPYDKDYNTIIPRSYTIYVNHAYRYNWE